MSNIIFPSYCVWYEMNNVCDVVSAFIHLPKMFPYTDFLFEWQIRQVTIGLIYIYLYTKLIDRSAPLESIKTTSMEDVRTRVLEKIKNI